MNLTHDTQPGNPSTVESPTGRVSGPPHPPQIDADRKTIRGVTLAQLVMIADRAVPRVRRTLASTTHRSTQSNSADILARARAYCRTKDPSVSGCRGHNALLDACRDMLTGYLLSHADALAIIIEEFNPKCSPPWEVRDIERKLDECDRTEASYGKLPGYLLNAGRVSVVTTANQPASPRRTLKNYVWDEVQDGETMRKTMKGKTLPAIANDLATMTGGWPKRVGTQLFVIDHEQRPLYLRTTDSLFAWIGSTLARGHEAESDPVDWSGRVGISKSEFRSYLEQNAERYDGIELAPHHPQLAGLYYAHPPLCERYTGALDELVSLFKPATDVDADLILAYFVTLFWGGPAGKRPVWLFTADDNDNEGGRGVGKTEVATIGTKLVGGYIAAEQSDDFSRLKTRLLSPEATGKRVMLLDNVKSLRFSWGELEGLVTSEVISGHVLHVGEGCRPNHISVVITANSPSLSSDLAKRAIVVKIKRPVYDPAWLDKVNALIVARRWDVISDCVQVLDTAGQPLRTSTRWAAWESGVLAKLPSPVAAQAAQAAIAERQNAINDDADEADTIREAIARLVATKYRSDNPESEVVLIESAVLAQCVAPLMGKRMAAASTNTISRAIGALTIDGLRKSDRKGRRLWLWCGSNTEQHKKPEYVITNEGFESLGNYIGSDKGIQ